MDGTLAKHIVETEKQAKVRFLLDIYKQLFYNVYRIYIDWK